MEKEVQCRDFQSQVNAKNIELIKNMEAFEDFKKERNSLVANLENSISEMKQEISLNQEKIDSQKVEVKIINSRWNL
jgi:hypothetical protein